MAGVLVRGFKASAERLAEEIRAEHGIDPYGPLDCTKLCEDLGIPVHSLSGMLSLGAQHQSVSRLAAAAKRFSAVTVCAGTQRLIVYNDADPPGRRANSLAHELSHIFREHPISPALGPGGCRHWDERLESEADWQAGALLVPRGAALRWMKNDGDIDRGAAYFGVSRSLFNWRVSQTGVVRQLSSRATYFLPRRTA